MTFRQAALGLTVLVLALVGSATPRSAAQEATDLVGHSPSAPVSATGPGLRTGAPPTSAIPPAATAAPLERVTRSGILAHMGAGWPADYLALPIGAGHRVELCGAGGCLTLTSTDAGPNRAMLRQGRVADSSVQIFEAVCGVPSSVGLCDVVWTVR